LLFSVKIVTKKYNSEEENYVKKSCQGGKTAESRTRQTSEASCGCSGILRAWMSILNPCPIKGPAIWLYQIIQRYTLIKKNKPLSTVPKLKTYSQAKPL